MPITTTGSMENRVHPDSKQKCWDCGKPDKVLTPHPAYPNQSYCRACCGKMGLIPQPITIVKEMDDGSEA